LVLLRLASPLESHFGALAPMEPISHPSPFNSSYYIYQIKWDGVRLLAFFMSGQIRLQSRQGKDKTRQYPELQKLRDMIKCKEVVLDGEAVVMKAGQPNFPGIIERDFSRKESRIKNLQKKLPVTYCVFDLLYCDGLDATTFSLEKRQEILKNVFSSITPPIYLNENFLDGEILFREVVTRSLEGIVAKEKDSQYYLNRKSSCWLKIKNRQVLTAIVAGISLKQGRPNAIILGKYQDKELRYIGKVGAGLSQQVKRLLEDYLKELKEEKPELINPPILSEVIWLKPKLEVEVEFSEWTDKLLLRSPVFKRLLGERRVKEGGFKESRGYNPGSD